MDVVVTTGARGRGTAKIYSARDGHYLYLQTQLLANLFIYLDTK